MNNYRLGKSFIAIPLAPNFLKVCHMVQCTSLGHTQTRRHIHTQTYTHTDTHRHIHTQTHTHINLHTQAHTHRHTRTYIYTHRHIQTYRHRHTHTHTIHDHIINLQPLLLSNTSNPVRTQPLINYKNKQMWQALVKLLSWKSTQQHNSTFYNQHGTGL